MPLPLINWATTKYESPDVPWTLVAGIVVAVPMIFCPLPSSAARTAGYVPLNV